MSQITALSEGKSRHKRIRLYLDGRYALSLAPEVVFREGLRVGQQLAPEELARLSRADQGCRSLDAALHYLECRPRSEFEVRLKLAQRGFPGEDIEATLNRLRELGLVDDRAFAQFWKENREQFRPRSRALTRLELHRKGVAGDIIEQVLGDCDDSESAYQAARSQVRRMSREDRGVFRQRLGDYLRRRGFSYEVAARTVARLWQEGEDG
jgi:regulatory protein